MRSTPYECTGKERCEFCDGDGFDWTVSTEAPGKCSLCFGTGECDCDCCEHKHDDDNVTDDE